MDIRITATQVFVNCFLPCNPPQRKLAQSWVGAKWTELSRPCKVLRPGWVHKNSI